MEKFFQFLFCIIVLTVIAAALAFGFYAAVDWFGIFIPTFIGATSNAALIVTTACFLFLDDAQPSKDQLSPQVKIGIVIIVLGMTLLNFYYLSDNNPSIGAAKAKPFANANQKGEKNER